MGTGNVGADEVVLNMLQQYEVLMMEDLIAGRPDFSWAQLFLAIDRLSRKNLITLRRVGMDFEIRTMNHGGTLDQTNLHAQPAAHP